MKKKPNYTVILITVVVFGITAWSLTSMFSGSGPSEAEKKEIMAKGKKADATLVSVQRTGNIVNDIHQYEFYFKVMPVSGETIEYSEKKLVDPIYMSSIKVGMQIPAYISADGKKTLILWESVGIKDAF